MTSGARVGRYTLHGELGSGGMAAVHLASAPGPRGATTAVAVKRLHPHVASSPRAVEMFLDEARVTERVRHPNVVALLDVVSEERDLAIVVEYVHGVSLAVLADRARERLAPIPIPIAAAIAVDVLRGLEAAHAATDEHGTPLGIVHRDVSPQNVLVGADGSTRVLDFGIARASVRLQTTRDGELKGKLRYMAPEQLSKDELSAATDAYATAVVVWELLTGERLFVASSEGATMAKVLEGVVTPPSAHRSGISPALDAVVLAGLSRKASERPSCRALAERMATATSIAPKAGVAAWVASLAEDVLEEREALLRALERGEGPAVASSTRRRASDDATRTVVPLAPPPNKHEMRARGIAVAAVALVAIAGFGLAARARTTIPEPVIPASSAPPPSGTTPPIATPATATIAPTSATPSAPPETPRPRPSLGKASPKAPPPDPCKPRYVTGPDGIRRVKPECL